jgi:hypothetical protein
MMPSVLDAGLFICLIFTIIVMWLKAGDEE